MIKSSNTQTSTILIGKSSNLPKGCVLEPFANYSERLWVVIALNEAYETKNISSN